VRSEKVIQELEKVNEKEVEVLARMWASPEFPEIIMNFMMNKSKM